MRTEVIKADTIDAAAERILLELKEEDTSTTARSIGSRDNVIYFDGWDGLGATAVLRAVAQRLAEAPAPAGLQFDQIIHINCSKWESRRAMQRAIAEELELPAEVMEMLDRQDEEDDYNGEEEGSRAQVPQVVRETYQSIENRRFLIIFYNGSGEEIDLNNFGFPLQDLGFHLYSRNKVLWTFQGAFRLKSRTKIEEAMKGRTMTGVFLSAVAAASADDEDVHWSDFVRQEAAELATRKDTGFMDLQPAQVTDCFLYILNLCGMGRHFTVDYDLATHGSNYWVCDGMVQPQHQLDDDDRSWRAADALKREMQLDMDYYHHHLPPHMVKCAETMPCWTSPTYRIVQILDGGIPSTGDIFRHYDKLGVLRLSRCTFSFSSPPFLCCHNLRFLALDRCKDCSKHDDDGAAWKEEDHSQHCFQRLWVLDVRYTCCDRILSARMLDLMAQLRELNVMGAPDSWDMDRLHGRLPNIRKLRVTESTVSCCSSGNDVDLMFPGTMKKMELLEFSGNRIKSSVISTAADNNSLLAVETIIIDKGCVGLKEISFRGCAKLKDILLKGLFSELGSIDISGTAVKTLDLSAVAALRLGEVIALDCDKLCAILWPPKENRKKYLSRLRIDTTVEGRSASATAGSSSLSAKYGSRAPTDYNWYVFVKDARLLRSLAPLEEYFDGNYVHMEVSSSPSGSTADVVGGSKRITKSDDASSSVVYQGIVTCLKHQESNERDDDADDAPTPITQMWPCPRAPSLGSGHCYVYIQDHPFDQPMKSLREKATAGASNSTSTITAVPDMICRNAAILHVHDSKSITCVPGPLQGSTWGFLEWCRVERCPRLECVFTCPNQVIGDEGLFRYIKTLWSSQLPRVRCIWNLSTPSSEFNFHRTSFEDLEFVHVDLCPRLTHVLPLSPQMIDCGVMLRRLETLEIVWCGDLRAVFPVSSLDNTDDDEAESSRPLQVVEFPRLKRVHLHELPRLHGICGRSWRMYAPNLESIKVRGCWSLTRLPAVGGGDYNNKVECDCEKEWWDKLKWDGMHANHAPSLYKPTHPRHYKKTFLRPSLLR